MAEKRVFKDPLMTHPAILAYRDSMKLVPNSGFRKDIAATIKDLDLWKSVLNNWRYKVKAQWKGKNPLAIKEMLNEYEFQLEKRNSGHGETATVSTRGRERLSTGSDGYVSKVRIEPSSLYFRVS